LGLKSSQPGTLLLINENAVQSFPNQVPLLSYNSNLSSNAINQALIELASRTEQLLQQLAESAGGRALTCTNEPTSPGVIPFSVVSWDPAAKRFDLALALLNASPGGEMVADALAITTGICVKKRNTTVGDITIAGAITLTAANVATLLNNAAPVSGVLYLSTTNSGTLTQTKPAVGIVVGYLVTPSDGCSATYQLILNSGVNSNWLGQDRVIEYTLAAKPAGTHVPPAFGGTHQITSPDINKQGWLPASHAVFGGTAPVGAIFGYNIDKDPALLAMWPPAGKRMVLDFMSKADIGTAGLKRVPASLFAINNRTIWWMTNCYSQVPWDYELDTNVNFPLPACEIDPPTQLIATFDRSPLDNSGKVVTKLRGSADGVVTFVDASGVVAVTGDLTAKLNSSAAVTATNQAGSTVLKTLGDGFKFQSGVVVEGVRSTDPTLSVTGTLSRLIDPSLAESPTNYRYQQGIVTIAKTTTAIGQDLSPSLIRVGDSLQRAYKGVSYIGFPNLVASSIAVRFDVPNGLTATQRLTPYVVMFGRGVGPMAAMTASYYVISGPPRAGGPQIITDVPNALAFDVVTPSTGLLADAVFKTTADSVVLYAGDTIFITFARAAGSTYPFDIGFIRIGALLQPYNGVP
jgi:hypothetical protein